MAEKSVPPEPGTLIRNGKQIMFVLCSPPKLPAVPAPGWQTHIINVDPEMQISSMFKMWMLQITKTHIISDLN